MPQLRARAGGELPRAGAPRPLRLVASDGASLSGLPRDVAWERGGGGVFFTLERGGTRNIWRASPDAGDKSRFPAWRASPVTDLRAPRFAAQPCPLPDDRSIVCVSNVLSDAPSAGAISQIVRYDLAKAKFRALSDSMRFYDSPRVSPDGKHIAFTGGTGVRARVYEADAQNSRNRALPFVTRVADEARHPVWLDDETLLVERLSPQTRGLYWMPVKTNAANGPSGDVAASRVVVGGGGEANTLGENGIVFSAKTSVNSAPGLYLVARDGSGLRALAATAGARRPAVSPDGQTLAYDAPLADGHALWIVPLLRVEMRAAAHKRRARFCADDAPEYDGPSVQLASVRAVEGGIAILGSLRGAANSTVTLEVGQGGKPKRWENLSVIVPPSAPLTDAQGNRVLAIWNPPARARGDWTLRLSLRGLGGGTQSLLRVRLPLPPAPPAPQILPAPVAPPNDAVKTEDTTRSHDAATPLPRATPLPALPDVTPVRDPFLPSPVAPSLVPTPDENSDDMPSFPAIESPFPSPDIAVAPPKIAPAPPAKTPKIAPAPPAKTPTTAGVAIVPIDPALFWVLPPTAPNPPAPNATVPNAPTPNAPTPNPSAPNATVPNAQTPTVARDKSDESGYGERPDAPVGTPFVAQFDVAGTPARVAPREKVKVTFWGINRGAATWQTGASGANRVRIVARWVDFSTGTRRQWNLFWLGESVAPGERTKMEFVVPAPARAGKYKLIYGLVRLPANGEYRAPAYNKSQETWPGEFGAIAFAVEVN